MPNDNDSVAPLKCSNDSIAQPAYLYLAGTVALQWNDRDHMIVIIKCNKYI